MSRLTADFNKLADKFSNEYNQARIDLEKCLETKVNDDINFICKKPKEAYLKGIAFTFCQTQYDTAVTCQKAAGDRWASDCFNQNVAFGQCADEALRKLYIYNMEHSKKNPSAN